VENRRPLGVRTCKHTTSTRSKKTPGYCWRTLLLVLDSPT